MISDLVDQCLFSLSIICAVNDITTIISVASLAYERVDLHTEYGFPEWVKTFTLSNYGLISDNEDLIEKLHKTHIAVKVMKDLSAKKSKH